MGTARGIQGSYGVDAPWVPVLWYALAVAFTVIGWWNLRIESPAWWVLSIIYFFGGAVLWLVGGTLYLHTTLRGKFEVSREVLDSLDLRGDETVLDLGCGRGAVTVLTAQRVPRGRVVGLDRWRRRDQSGNAAAATRANLVANDVAARVALTTGDLTRLPFADASFDLCVASLAIHNVPNPTARGDAVREAVRVLRPGGRLVIVDISRVKEYVAELEHLGIPITTNRSAGWRMWWSGPWMATRILVARR